jgi:glutamate synthase (NADPH/NADH) large chain
MMIPEAWENHEEMDAKRKAFYEFHSSVMEPWDGPAAVVFTDGTHIGAVLDRNGLRPGRFWVTDDGLVVLASETGVLDLDPERIVRKGRLQPGHMFLADLSDHRIIENDEIKTRLAPPCPTTSGCTPARSTCRTCPSASTSCTRTPRDPAPAGVRLHRGGAAAAARADGPHRREPIGSMGTDTPVAALSERPRLLFDYFSQLFAQVTNPPLDAIREELVTSLAGSIGPEWNLLDPGPASCRQVVLPFPVIDNDELAKLIHINRDGDLPGFDATS